jgi:sRNA-binding carbon storage regulator CsrA
VKLGFRAPRHVAIRRSELEFLPALVTAELAVAAAP